jgi:multiple sugar transport system permease protein
MKRCAFIAVHNAAIAMLASWSSRAALDGGASIMPRGRRRPTRRRCGQPTRRWTIWRVVSRLHLARYLFNSTFIALAITSIALVLNAMAGYAFAKLPFHGRQRTFQVLLGALVVPLQVGMLPLFLLLKQMGAINTYWAVILPSMATIYGMFLVRQYALAIPDSLLDAARIDGASEWRIFVSIVLPMLRPVLVTLGIFTFLSAWNDFMWPLIVLTGNDHYTLPVALAILSGEHVQDAELMMAGSLLTMLPVLGLFALLQRQLIGGIMVGGVKG